MNKAGKTVLWIIVILGLILIGHAFYKRSSAPATPIPSADTTPTTPPAPTTIKVGVLGPLTGDAAVYGEPSRNVMAMALDEINAGGGINGQKLEFIYEDGKCNGKDAASAMQKLVNADKVQAVIGGFCSSESLAAEPIATQNNVFLFSAGSSSPDLTGKSPLFARNYPSDASQGKTLAEVAYNKEGWKKVAFIQEQLDYPLGVLKAFTAEFTKLGGTVTKEEFPTATADFRSILTKTKDAKPDAVFVNTQAPAAAERIFKQMQELKWKPKLMINDATSGDVTMVANNAAFLEGVLTAEFSIDPTNAKFQQLLANYKAKYGVDAPYQSYASTEYDAPYILRDGLLAVGNSGEKLATWVRTVKDWPGASGLVTIGDNGDRVGGHVAKIIKKGKAELFTK